MLFQSLLGNVIKEGSLTLLTASGRSYVFGNGIPPRVKIKLHRRILEWSLALHPELRIGEAYMDGTLTIEEGDLRSFLHLLLMNRKNLGTNKAYKIWSALCHRAAKLKQYNPLPKAKRNVAYHYDLSGELYDLFLDADRQYSCAYFSIPNMPLEQAQLEKKKHIASKLLLNEPGLRVLDIGSGWGGTGLYLAREENCNVTGVTLSEEQHKISQQRTQAAGLDNTCRFELRDYRDEKGPYDRIVSVGMFEHVGKKNYEEFFAKVRDLLTDDGICLLHTIGCAHPGFAINPFILKHIFPGADLPALSEITEAIERSGLVTTDVEILRTHYADTLRIWNDRFQAHRTEAAKLYDERFCRKWEFYLIGCEMAFRLGTLMVFQIQLSKRFNTVPVTRDYMFDAQQKPKTQGYILYADVYNKDPARLRATGRKT